MLAAEGEKMVKVPSLPRTDFNKWSKTSAHNVLRLRLNELFIE